MNNPVIYIVINGELKMSPGKAAAQAVHASMTLGINSVAEFATQQKRTVIVLEAKNAEQIKNLQEYLDISDIDADYYIDEGVNEVDAYSVTALAAFVGDNEELRKMFEGFSLYNGHVQVYRSRDLRPRRETITIPGRVGIKSGFAFRALKRERQ
jgi:peptidyl-tRNA hydrolase